MTWTTKTFLITAIAAGFTGLTLIILVGALRIGASIWEALLITSSLIVAAVLLVGFLAQLLLRASRWLRERRDVDQHYGDPLP
jgi:hypothetical protein